MHLLTQQASIQYAASQEHNLNHLVVLQLHAAVVELSAAKNADIKYSTVQNWYPGDAEGKGGIYNFVTKRALCHGANSKVSWTQVLIIAALLLFGVLASRVAPCRLCRVCAILLLFLHAL